MVKRRWYWFHNKEYGTKKIRIRKKKRERYTVVDCGHERHPFDSLHPVKRPSKPASPIDRHGEKAKEEEKNL